MGKQQMRWYADNSELNGIREAEIPDILLFGGIAVSPESEQSLKQAIDAVKAKYGVTGFPLKWNFKDLKSKYEQEEKKDIYTHLLSKSKQWKKEIFESVRSLNFTIIVACVESNSVKRDVITTKKAMLTSFVFNNGLMRYALHVQEAHPDRAAVVLDWPDHGDTNPFDVEYKSAYFEGKSPDDIKYHSGKLEALNFNDSTFFTRMHYCTLLQFADLIVGSLREFVECALNKKETGYGLDMLKLVANKFRGYPDDVIGRGISVAGSTAGFREKIEMCFKTKIMPNQV